VRKKKIELEQAVIRAAKEWLLAGDAWTEGGGYDDPSAFLRSVAELRDATRALAALKPSRRLDAPGRWVEGSPETSAAAAQLARPALTSTRHAIICQIAVHGAHPAGRGLTDQALEHRLKRSHTTASSARNFLVEGGWLQDSGYVRKNTSGRDAVVWELTPAARDDMSEWRSM